MIVATLDTNVLASGALASHGAVGQVIEEWFHGDFIVVLSPFILGELERVFRKPYFAKRVSAESIASYVELVRDLSTVIPVTGPLPKVASHPEDDVVLATALSGKVDYLVTGDKDLQALNTYQGVTVLSPQDFLQVLVG